MCVELIETLAIPGILSDYSGINLYVKWVAKVECGCAAHVGRFQHNKEPGMFAVACSKRHQLMIEEFVNRYRKSLQNPEDTAAVAVADRLLTAIAKEFG